MSHSFLNFRSDATLSPFLRSPIFVSFAISALIFIVTIVYYLRAQPQLPLYYSLARPAQHLVSKEWLFILPGASLVMITVHTFLAQLFKEYHPVILQLFVWVTVILQLLLLLIFMRIVLITV